MLSAGETQTLRTPSTGASYEIKRPSGDNFAPKNVGLSNSFRRGIRGRTDMSAPVDEIPDGTGIRLLSTSRQRSIRRQLLPADAARGRQVASAQVTSAQVTSTMASTCLSSPRRETW